MGMAGGMAGVMDDTPSIERGFWGTLGGVRRRFYRRPVAAGSGVGGHSPRGFPRVKEGRGEKP